MYVQNNNNNNNSSSSNKSQRHQHQQLKRNKTTTPANGQHQGRSPLPLSIPGLGHERERPCNSKKTGIRNICCRRSVPKKNPAAHNASRKKKKTHTHNPTLENNSTIALVLQYRPTTRDKSKLSTAYTKRDVIIAHVGQIIGSQFMTWICQAGQINSWSAWSVWSASCCQVEAVQSAWSTVYYVSWVGSVLYR